MVSLGVFQVCGTELPSDRTWMIEDYPLLFRLNAVGLMCCGRQEDTSTLHLSSGLRSLLFSEPLAHALDCVPPQEIPSDWTAITPSVAIANRSSTSYISAAKPSWGKFQSTSWYRFHHLVIRRALSTSSSTCSFLSHDRAKCLPPLTATLPLLSSQSAARVGNWPVWRALWQTQR